MKHIAVRRYATQATVHEMILAHSGDITATGARTFNVVTLEQTDWVVVPDDDPRVDTIEDFRVPTCSQQVNHPNGFVVGCELPIGHLGKHAALIHDVDEYRWAGGPMESPTPSPLPNSALPWKVVPNPMRDDGVFIVRDRRPDEEAAYAGQLEPGVGFGAQMPRALAEFVVSSCNAHAALVEALKACLQMAWTAKPRKLDEALSWVENDEKAREMARAALALAEPKS